MYLRYSYLWAEDKEDQLKNFIESEPYLYEIKEKFEGYESLFIEINNLPDYHTIGCLRINMGESVNKHFLFLQYLITLLF